MKAHTQIIRFTDGSKKTIQNVVKIEEGDLTKLTNDKGVEYLINQNHVLWVIRGTSEQQTEQTTTTRGYNLKDEEDYDEPVSEEVSYI